MLHTHIRPARFVGVAPGTTTMQLGAPPNGQARWDVWPTQSIWEPDPNSDQVKIAVPPNQWVTGPTVMRINMPAHQKNFGPFPNDQEMSTMRPGYLPVMRGWIEPASGEPIFTLGHAPLGDIDDTAVKWTIAASVISALALATTTIIAIARYKSGR